MQTAEKQARLTQINLRALHPATMRKLERLHFSFWAATNLKGSRQPHLKLMERQRSKVWLERAFSDIQRVIEYTSANQTPSDNNVLSFEPVAVDVVN